MPGKRGFAAMDKDAQRAIASKGGRAAHQRGTAHEFTPEEAAEAGRKGGRAVSRDRRHMAEIGRKGGKAAHSGQQAGAEPMHMPGAPMTAPSNPMMPEHAQMPGTNGHNGHMMPANGQMPAANGQTQGHNGQMPAMNHQGQAAGENLAETCPCPMPASSGEPMTAGS
jgi:general stress protein YciG